MAFDKYVLIKLRIQNKISQRELAMRVGIEPCVISNLEKKNNTKNPSFDSVARIAEYFEVPMEKFKTGSLL